MWTQLKARICEFARDEKGASAIEYGLIAGLVAAIIIIAVTGMGTNVGEVFTGICNSIGGTGTCS